MTTVPEDPNARRDARPTSRFEARVRRVVATRRIFPVLLLATVALAVLAGFIATLVDPEDFPTFGVGVWWAIVTLATVGYGDVVPTNTWGRVALHLYRGGRKGGWGKGAASRERDGDSFAPPAP